MHVLLISFFECSNHDSIAVHSLRSIHVLVLLISASSSWCLLIRSTFLWFHLMLFDVQTWIVTVVAADRHVMRKVWLRYIVLRPLWCYVLYSSLILLTVLSIINGWHVRDLVGELALCIPIVVLDIILSSLHVIVLISFSS